MRLSCLKACLKKGRNSQELRPFSFLGQVRKMTLENAVNIVTIFALAIGLVLGVLQIVDTYLDIREKWPK